MRQPGVVSTRGGIGAILVLLGSCRAAEPVSANQVNSRPTDDSDRTDASDGGVDSGIDSGDDGANTDNTDSDSDSGLEHDTGDSGGPDTATPVVGDWVDVSAGMYTACGIHTDGSLSCWGDNARSPCPNSPPTEGDFVAVALTTGTGCAIEFSGEILCWGNEENAPDLNDPPAGVWVSLRCGAGACVAIDSHGSLGWWGSTYSARVAPTGVYLAADVGVDPDWVCAVDADGGLTCWDEDGAEWQHEAPAGSFRDVTAGDRFTCGVTDDQNAVCWGMDQQGQATPP